LTVRFSLPAGAYASLVIGTLTRHDPWLGGGSGAQRAEGENDADDAADADGGVES
jgi:hypothetical protein